MRIGIDFDNTIACYDGVFHAAALERGLIEEGIPKDKNSVRDYLNGAGLNDAFTELQGYVYGARMDLVSPYEGALSFIREAHQRGADVFVVSHKTKKPMMGKPYDLHASARGFLKTQAITGPEGPIAEERAHFEVTKEEKIARAVALGVDVFIDDLPEILAMDGWPSSVRRILFDPEGHYPKGEWKDRRFERYASWGEIQRAVFDT